MGPYDVEQVYDGVHAPFHLLVCETMIKSIRIAETEYHGIAEITADGWDGRILRMSHPTCCKWIASSATPQPAGVYLLYADHFDRATHGNQLYVGQTGAIGQRLGQHIGKKEFWTAVMVFTSAGDWMNVAYTPNIERQFIEWAKQANRYDLDNGDDGREEHLGQEDQARLQSFLAGVRPALRLAGIDVFEPNLDGIFSYAGIQGRASSHLKIASGPPSPAVTILAGSRFDGLDQAKVSRANLPGVTYDTAGRIHTFSESVEVALSGWELVFLPKLFDQSVTRWTSKSGITLTSALKRFWPNE
jgi:hypothetical protein